MNIIDGSADSSVRQVVPQDFSFLSTADMQVVEALEGIIRVMFGLGDNPIWCGRMVVESVGYVNNVRRWVLRAGKLLYKGVIYDVEETDCTGANALFAKMNTYIQLTENIVAPSPVYGADGNKSVSVHKRAIGLGVAPASVNPLPEGIFRLSDIVVLPEVVTQRERRIVLP